VSAEKWALLAARAREGRANSFRTSHYPYAEEHLELADRHGILVIHEVAAVGMHFMRRGTPVCHDRVNAETRQNHIEAFRALHERDRNHPCVVMWSIANEAATYEKGTRAHFKPIIAAARKLTSLPLTLAHCPAVDECRVADLVDVLCLNRYYAWYFDPGRIEQIGAQLERNLRDWHRRYGKPLIIRIRRRYNCRTSPHSPRSCSRRSFRSNSSNATTKSSTASISSWRACLELRRLQHQGRHLPNHRQPQRRLHPATPTENGRARAA